MSEDSKKGYGQVLENFQLSNGEVHSFLKHLFCYGHIYPYHFLTDIFPQLFFLDVIGQIVEIINVEIVSLNGKDTEKITLELHNQLYVFLFLKMIQRLFIVSHFLRKIWDGFF